MFPIKRCCIFSCQAPKINVETVDHPQHISSPITSHNIVHSIGHLIQRDIAAPGLPCVGGWSVNIYFT